jgi:hypothetical protein
MANHTEQFDRSITTSTDTSRNNALGTHTDSDIRAAHTAETTRRQGDSTRYQNDGVLPALHLETENEQIEKEKNPEGEAPKQGEGSQPIEPPVGKDLQQPKEPGGDGAPGPKKEGDQSRSADSIQNAAYISICPDGTVVKTDTRAEAAKKCGKVS